MEILERIKWVIFGVVVGRRRHLCRRGGNFCERDIEYAFLFSNLYLARGPKVLEVGSGRCGIPLVLAHIGYDVRVIDVKPEHPWVEKGDATRLDFEDNSFDIVVCISVVEHIVDCDKAVSEMLRIVRPEGIIILSFPYNPFRSFKDIYVKTGVKARYICSIFNDEKLKCWFDKEAEIVAVEYWSQWSGALWTEGVKNLRATRVGKENAQGICIAVRKLKSV